MLSNRKTAAIVGILFLTATATYLTADTITRSALSRPDIFMAATSDAIALRFAALLALVCGIADIAIALLMYPLFKSHSVRLALGHVQSGSADLGRSFFSR